ncbi:MAG: transglutaminase N-terminal domain-containing protein [Succinivibrionaceae bacterium]
MILKIEHKTTYTYDTDVKYSIQHLRLTPRKASNQRIISWVLETPYPAQVITDGFNNEVHILTMDKTHKNLTFVAKGMVEVNGQEAIGDDGLDPIFYLRNTELTKPGELIKKFANKYSMDMRPIDLSLKDMANELLKFIPYDKTKTNTKTTAEQAMELGGGVCQDHTHIFISCCRVRNIPARYVSGYIYTPNEDHVSSHAWAEAYFDGGWHTFDVSNQLFSPSQHIKIAIGLDYLSACPVRGMRIGGDTETMSTETRVTTVS